MLPFLPFCLFAFFQGPRHRGLTYAKMLEYSIGFVYVQLRLCRCQESRDDGLAKFEC